MHNFLKNRVKKTIIQHSVSQLERVWRVLWERKLKYFVCAVMRKGLWILLTLFVGTWVHCIFVNCSFSHVRRSTYEGRNRPVLTLLSCGNCSTHIQGNNFESSCCTSVCRNVNLTIKRQLIMAGSNLFHSKIYKQLSYLIRILTT